MSLKHMPRFKEFFINPKKAEEKLEAEKNAGGEVKERYKAKFLRETKKENTTGEEKEKIDELRKDIEGKLGE